MKLRLNTIGIAALSIAGLSLQQSAGSDYSDLVEAAIESFNNRDRNEPNEALALFNAEPAKAVLVTGKPPRDTGLIDITDIPVDPGAAQDLPPSRPEAKGLEVRVEQLHAGAGNMDPEKVHLLAPFPAKPLHEAPPGWLLESANSAPAIKRQVELAPGKAITLTIKPHVLVPDADQERILAVLEPGFEASLGYKQSDTISAVLSDSIRKLDEDSQRIGNAIDQLQQLVISLPKPDSSPQPKPDPSSDKSQPDGASSIPDANTPIPEQP